MFSKATSPSCIMSSRLVLCLDAAICWLLLSHTAKPLALELAFLLGPRPPARVTRSPGLDSVCGK